MSNPIIETDIAQILREIKDEQKSILNEIRSGQKEIKDEQKSILNEMRSGQKEILKEISDIKVGLETVKGNIKALDVKVEQLDKRVANQEFLNRGVFIGLLLASLG